MAKSLTNDLLDGEVTEQDINKAIESLQLTKGKETDPKDEEEAEEEEAETLTKAVASQGSGLNSGKAFGALMKGILSVKTEQRTRDLNMGVLLKGMFETNMRLSNRTEELEATITLLQKGLEDVAEKLDQPVERKAAVVSKARERGFEKGLQGDDLTKGGEKDEATAKRVNIASPAGRNLVKSMLSEQTFAKGFDNDMAQATLGFDANGVLSKSVATSLEKVYNVELVSE